LGFGKLGFEFGHTSGSICICLALISVGWVFIIVSVIIAIVMHGLFMIPDRPIMECEVIQLFNFAAHWLLFIPHAPFINSMVLDVKPLKNTMREQVFVLHEIFHELSRTKLIPFHEVIGRVKISIIWLWHFCEEYFQRKGCQFWGADCAVSVKGKDKIVSAKAV